MVLISISIVPMIWLQTNRVTFTRSPSPIDPQKMDVGLILVANECYVSQRRTCIEHAGIHTLFTDNCWYRYAPFHGGNRPKSGTAEAGIQSSERFLSQRCLLIEGQEFGERSWAKEPQKALVFGMNFIEA